MRKMLLVVLAVVMMAGCTKTKGVVGSTFAAFGYHVDDKVIAGMHFDGYDAYRVYRFIDSGTAEKTTRKYSPQGEIIGDIETCTYSYSYPAITITYKNYDGSDRTVTGEFLDNDTFRIGKEDYIRQ